MEKLAGLFGRPTYQRLAIRMLDYLSEQPNYLPTKKLLEVLKVKKSSLFDVIGTLEASGYVETRPYFGNQKSIKVTTAGNEFYHNLSSPSPYELPARVKLYLKSKSIEKLSPLQDMFVSRGLLQKSCNVSVFGYPGTGKTLIAGMLMANEVDSFKGKALYCTPYKALDSQKYEEFNTDFGLVGMKVCKSDGDSPTKQKELQNSDIIIATYERVMKALKAREPWIDGIKMVCADEITLLGDESRGSSIDFVITEFLMQNKRIVTLSSLVGNIPEISEWLGAECVKEASPNPETKINEYVIYRRGLYLYIKGQNLKEERIDSDENALKYLVKKNLSENKTTIIFANFRRGTEILAKSLYSSHAPDENLAKEAFNFLRQLKSDGVEITKLTIKELFLLQHGIAFHHAGLQKKVRNFVEKLLAENKLKTIVSTTTLSHGVNYKIDRVILDIRSFRNLPLYEYINIKGRTGRPNLSTTADVYIISESEEVDKVIKKFFFGSTEPVYPKTTEDKDLIGIIALAKIGEKKAKAREVSYYFSHTLGRKKNSLKSRMMTDVLNDLERFKFIKNSRGVYNITKLGCRVNDADMPPYDANTVLRLRTSYNTDKILEIASSIDIMRSMIGKDSENSIRNCKVKNNKILKWWIRGVSLQEIVEKTKLDDEDVFKIARYSRQSLVKMSKLITNKKVKDRMIRLSRKISKRLEKF